jgi:hypothetical protein
VKDKQPTKDALLDLGLMSKASATFQALFDHLRSDRVLLPASQSTNSTLAAIGNLVVRIDTEFLTGDLQFSWAKNTISYPRPVIRTTLREASEADVLDAQSNTEQNGSGAERVLVALLLKLVRQGDQPAEILRIEIVNASELSQDKVLTIKRGDDGQDEPSNCSVANLKKESASVHCHPTARAPPSGDVSRF